MQKALSSPQNVRFSEFQKLLEHYGFQLKRSEGSHFIYKNSKFKKLLPIEEKNGLAKVYQVKQFLKILEENNVV